MQQLVSLVAALNARRQQPPLASRRLRSPFLNFDGDDDDDDDDDDAGVADMCGATPGAEFAGGLRAWRARRGSSEDQRRYSKH